jgi:tetratricopeptide (TPR) repeat protein
VAKDKAKGDSGDAAEEQAFEVSPEILQMAKSCFEGADEASRRNNFDYAITLYLQGLRYTPDDVENGHRPLYDAARRMKAGRKKNWGAKAAKIKASVLQTMGKKREAFFELERALPGNPDSSADLAMLAQSAQNLGLKKTAIFFAEQTLETARRTNKLTEAMCVQMTNIYEAHGLFREAMVTLQDAEKFDKTQSGRHTKRIRDLAAQTTIDSGLEDAKDIRDRLVDKEYADESSQQRVVTAQDELTQRAEKMTEDLEKTPNDVNLIITIGDTYVRAEDDENAMKFYRKARTVSGGADYRVKVKMDDLKIRQIRRKLRQIDDQLADDADNEELKQQRRQIVDDRNRFELEVFKERADEYPTDMTVRYELGLRHYRRDEVNDAIGAFQMSTRDPKRKILSLNMLGKCFFQRKLFQEAAAQFKAAIDAHEIEGDEMWKELRYNLGLTFEAIKRSDQAAECYSQIVMSDFQYRDAAKRLQDIRDHRTDQAGTHDVSMT